jgi:TetR/AcrR family transcriptional regulator
MKNQNDNTPRNTKQLIADTSMRLFYELGYEKATIRKIAEACGITHAAIFKYYKSKEELACLFISRYLSWLIKHSLTFSQT